MSLFRPWTNATAKTTFSKQTGGTVPQGPPDFVHYNFDTTGNIVRGAVNFKF